MTKANTGDCFTDDQAINVGDRVRVEFRLTKNDLCGDVVYKPVQPGDVWIIRSEDRLFYVQHYSTISKRLSNDYIKAAE